MDKITDITDITKTATPPGITNDFKYFRILRRRVLLLVAVVMLALGSATLAGCSDHDDEWDDVPQTIQMFLAKYFPGQGVSSVTHAEAQWRVKLKNSASLTFNDSLNWTQVNGQGETLPQMFVSDALPPQFVEEYLQVTDNVGSVYAVTRDRELYTVVLQNYTVLYDAETGITRQLP